MICTVWVEVIPVLRTLFNLLLRIFARRRQVYYRVMEEGVPSERVIMYISKGAVFRVSVHVMRRCLRNIAFKEQIVAGYDTDIGSH